MKVLLVYPEIPPTYWGFQHALRLAGKASSLPPHGLISVAALLPAHWELRLVDANVRPLDDGDLGWADLVLVSGMQIQKHALLDVVRRSRAAGRRVVVGGPAATVEPEAFAEADCVFRGEAEQRIETLVRAIESGAPLPAVLGPPEGRPAMAAVPVPRFDLLELGRYASVSIQFSRGCPHRCEFCDVIELFGRRPRVKSSEQVLDEMAVLYARGYRGSVFVVDDNFIGHKPAARELLARLEGWQEGHGRPFDLYTEASLELASDPELVRAMVRAGFSCVFLGIETPSAQALREAGKRQNLRTDLAQAVRRLTAAGLEVYGGFIVGFDSDDASVFEQQWNFISSLPMPLAMVGVLTAPPGTALWQRLRREGRLRQGSTGDQFGRPNFVPRMDEGALLRGYRALLARLYEPEAYFRRCERYLAEVGSARPGRGVRRREDLATLLRAMWHLGIVGRQRACFWRLLGRSLRRSPRLLPWAVASSIRGEHLIRYTREDVLPRLDRALAELGRAPAQAEGMSSQCLPLGSESNALTRPRPGPTASFASDPATNRPGGASQRPSVETSQATM
ncbi:MAG: DUF4070 domain-containing protein [Deltaproteobacteria bacterium]|nr:DUF4070 domain-containing protein [Deltaproteobacteria bacterium]